VTAPEGSQRRSSFARIVFATYATNVGTALLSLLSVLVVARSLGPTGRGEVAFLIAIATLVGLLGTLGAQDAIANIGGANPSKRGALVSGSIILGLVYGAVSVAALLLASAISPGITADVAPLYLAVALVGIPLGILKNYLQFLLQSDYRFAVTNLAWLAGPVTTFAANSALAATGRLSVLTAIVAWVAGQGLGFLVVVTAAARRFGVARPEWELMKRVMSFGGKAHVPRAMTIANYRANLWILGALAGSHELGLFSVASAWTEALFYLPGVLVLIQRPDLVRATEREAGRAAVRVFRICVLLSVPLGLFLAIAAPFLCTVIFGDDFSGSVGHLRILALSAVGISACEVFGNALTAIRRPLLSAVAMSVSFVVMMGLCVALIPILGGTGAALATTTAWTLGGLAMAYVFSRALDLSMTEMIPRPSDFSWFRRRLAARLGHSY
jgi:O-antigen/teichoic acid export membrane protein